MSRHAIRNSVRFEVFKRDSFTCQYCGIKAPDVVLEIDHIIPVSAGGNNEILNLVTACRVCNSGKSDKRLSESSVVEKARRQAEDMQERRHQLEMIAEWHSSLLDIDTEAVEKLEQLWMRSTCADEGEYLVDVAKDELRSVIKRHGFDIACQGVVQASRRYMKRPANADHYQLLNEAFWSISKICSVLKADKDDPGVARLFYIRGIARNRFSYMHEGVCISLLKEARSAGVPVEWMEMIAKSAEVKTWSDWKWLMDDAISNYTDNPSEDEEATDGR